MLFRSVEAQRTENRDLRQEHDRLQQLLLEARRYESSFLQHTNTVPRSPGVMEPGISSQHRIARDTIDNRAPPMMSENKLMSPLLDPLTRQDSADFESATVKEADDRKMKSKRDE